MRNDRLHGGARVHSALFVCLLVGLCFVCKPSHANADDEPRRGLLADGRAFRTDQNGNQLVDYIAELEVNVESLEKRVYGLEDEVKEKQLQIERLQGGSSQGAGLQERSLIAESDVSSRQECPACPVVRPVNVAADDAQSEKIAALKRAVEQSQVRASQTESELAAARDELQRARAALGGERNSQALNQRQLQEQLRHAQEQLQTERDNRSREVASYEAALKQVEEPNKASERQVEILKKSVEEYRLQVSSEQSRRKVAEEQSRKLLEQKQQEIEVLRAAQQDLQSQNREALTRLTTTQQVALQRKQEELEKLQDQLTELQVRQAQARKESSARAALSEQTAPMPRPFINSGNSPGAQPVSALAGARERAVTELRSEVASTLTQLKMSIQARDELFAKFDQRGRALQIRPSPLKSPSGATPDSIRDDLAVASSVRELVRLRDDVRGISAKVSDDIATVRRLSGSR